MKKIQIVLLVVFLMLFIVPEILWSSASNYIYALVMPLKDGSVQYYRQNFLNHIDNLDILSKILFIQFLGFFLATAYLVYLYLRKQLVNKIIFWVLTILLGLLAITMFLIFDMSVSLRHVGF